MRNYHMTKIIILTVAILISINCSVSAENLSTADKTLLKQHIALCKQQSADNQQIKNELDSRITLLDRYISVIKALKVGKSSQTKYLINSLERSKKYAVNYSKYGEKNYKTLQAQYDNLSSDKLKAAEVDDLEQASDRLIARISKRQLPFKKQEQKIINNINSEQKNRELKSLMASLISPKEGKQTVSADEINLNATFTTAFVSCNWKKTRSRLPGRTLELDNNQKIF